MSKNQRKKHKKNKIKKNKSIEKPSLDNRTTVQVAINKSISDKKESMGMKNLLGKIRQYAKSLTILFLSLLTIGFPIYLLYAYINEIESPNGLLSVLAMLVGFFIIYIFFLLFSGEITKESLYRTFVLFRERSPRLPQLICAMSLLFIFAVPLLQSKFDTWRKDPHGLVGAFTGIFASTCAASLVQILETWRSIRGRLSIRNKVLETLGVDPNLYLGDSDKRILVALSYFNNSQQSKHEQQNPEQIATSTQEIAQENSNAGYRLKIPGNNGDMGEDKNTDDSVRNLLSKEDVEAYTALTTLLSENEIKWKLVQASEIANQLEFLGNGYPLVEGNIVSIGAFSNRLSMAYYKFLREKNRAHAHAVKRESDRLFESNQASYYKVSGNGFFYRGIAKKKGRQDSVFIIAGITAEHTMKAGLYFETSWESVKTEFDSETGKEEHDGLTVAHSSFVKTL